MRDLRGDMSTLFLILMGIIVLALVMAAALRQWGLLDVG